MTKLLSLLLVLVTAVVSGQTSTVEIGQFLQADTAKIVEDGDGVQIFATGIKSGGQAAIVAAAYENPLVRAYSLTPPYRPIVLNYVDGLGHVLSKPGRWDVEILAVVEGRWVAEYLPDIVLTGEDTPTPGEPGNPPPDGDYADLTDWVEASVVAINDPARAETYLAALMEVDLSLQWDLLRFQFQEARRRSFVGVIEKDWRPFFKEADERMKSKTEDEYKQKAKAYIEGFENVEFVSAAWTTPPKPWTVGQIHNGYRYEMNCVDGSCFYRWVRITK